MNVAFWNSECIIATPCRNTHNRACHFWTRCSFNFAQECFHNSEQAIESSKKTGQLVTRVYECESLVSWMVYFKRNVHDYDQRQRCRRSCCRKNHASSSVILPEWRALPGDCTEAQRPLLWLAATRDAAANRLQLSACELSMGTAAGLGKPACVRDACMRACVMRVEYVRACVRA